MSKIRLRYEVGSLDLVSAGFVLAGMYYTLTPYETWGWILIVIGILKQFSGK